MELWEDVSPFNFIAAWSLFDNVYCECNARFVDFTDTLTAYVSPMLYMCGLRLGDVIYDHLLHAGEIYKMFPIHTHQISLQTRQSLVILMDRELYFFCYVMLPFSCCLS